MCTEIIELRFPLKTEYVSVLRATVGVVAGGMFYNYDEIIELQAAVSEAFEFTCRRVGNTTQSSPEVQLTVHFILEPARIEAVIFSPQDCANRSATEEEMEHVALLEILMDEVEVGSGTPGEPLIRAVKLKSAAR